MSAATLKKSLISPSASLIWAASAKGLPQVGSSAGPLILSVRILPGPDFRPGMAQERAVKVGDSEALLGRQTGGAGDSRIEQGVIPADAARVIQKVRGSPQVADGRVRFHQAMHIRRNLRGGFGSIGFSADYLLRQFAEPGQVRLYIERRREERAQIRGRVSRRREQRNGRPGRQRVGGNGDGGDAARRTGLLDGIIGGQGPRDIPELIAGEGQVARLFRQFPGWLDSYQ